MNPGLKEPPCTNGDRSDVIQYILDNIAPGWRLAGDPPDDNDSDVCILKNDASGKVAHAVLPENWFNGGMEGYIEWEIRRALKQAVKSVTAKSC